MYLGLRLRTYTEELLHLEVDTTRGTGEVLVVDVDGTEADTRAGADGSVVDD